MELGDPFKQTKIVLNHTLSTFLPVYPQIVDQFPPEAHISAPDLVSD